MATRITVKMLTDRKACDNQVNKFWDIFDCELVLKNKEHAVNLAKKHGHKFHIDWAALHLLNTPEQQLNYKNAMLNSKEHHRINKLWDDYYKDDFRLWEFYNDPNLPVYVMFPIYKLRRWFTSARHYILAALYDRWLDKRRAVTFAEMFWDQENNQ